MTDEPKKFPRLVETKEEGSISDLCCPCKALGVESCESCIVTSKKALREKLKRTTELLEIEMEKTDEALFLVTAATKKLRGR